MSEVRTLSRLEAVERPETTRGVSPVAISQILYALGAMYSWRTFYPEIAAAIAQAATDDPILTDREDGAEITACLLIAAAWEGSRFNPYDHDGIRVGLFRIRPPRRPGLAPSLLTTPRSACLVAIDLIRTSFSACAQMPWEQRLAWYLDLGTQHRAPSEAAVKRSSRVLEHAKKLFLRYYTPREEEPPVDCHQLRDEKTIEIGIAS